MAFPFEDEWFLHHGDNMEHMATLPDACMDFSVYSPPFPSVFAYQSSPADVGNSEQYPEFKIHFSYFFRAIRRIMKPGRVMMVHCTQIVRQKRSGGEGMFDFRGLLIRLGERAGFVFDYDWSIRKNPQSQAIRTRSHSLQFAGLESDRAKSRGAMPDFLLKFLVPGENAKPIEEEGQVSRNDWIEWAENCWKDIRETDTLNTKIAKGPEDTRHICPLQLQVIDRLVRLYSDPGEIVFDPFTGIGSSGYIAVKNERRFYGCELKPEYYTTACRNLAKASVENKMDSRTLYDKVGTL